MTGPLRADRIEVRFGEVLAVRHAEFEVRPGDLVAVTGPSGAGKSTLLSALAGLISPSAGRASLAGLPFTDRDDAVARGIVLIPQGNALLRTLTALENVAVPLVAAGRSVIGAVPGSGPSARWTRSGWRRPPISCWRSCPVASSSGSRLPAAWPLGAASCWPTSRPANWTPPTGCW